jgi:hypothetical protein
MKFSKGFLTVKNDENYSKTPVSRKIFIKHRFSENSHQQAKKGIH